MSQQKHLSSEKTTVSVKSDAHKRAAIAAALVGENLLEFLSRAADDRSGPILKKHGTKLPSDCELAAA